jgi:hypothetical protein
MNRSTRMRLARFTAAPGEGTMPPFQRPAAAMTRFIRLAAFALTLSLASTVHAEEKYFGLTRTQVSDVGKCSAETTLGIAAYMMYSARKPYAETLALALKANQSSDPKLPPADIERRLKAVYAAKPPSSASWGGRNFEQCVLAKKIPVIRERINTCYITSFYMAMMVDLRKNGGDSKEKISTDMTASVTDPKQKDGLTSLIAYYYDQPAATDPTAQSILDIRHFLTCASADQRPVSGSK